MKNKIQVNSTEDHFQDEISLTDIVLKLWMRRGLLVIMPVIFFLFGVVFLISTAVRTTAPTVYFVQLQGIEKSLYPNGTQFTPQDLLSQEVLASAVKPLGLAAGGKISEAISVEFGSPTSQGIHKKYQTKLANNKLSTAEINQINTQYEQELERASERGLRITIDHASLGLTSEQGAILASTLPRAWSELFIKKYRVFVDTKLDHVSIASAGGDNSLESTSDILFARKTLQRLKRGVTIINDDVRLKALTSDSGLNGADLLSQVQRFEELYFRPIFSAVFSHSDQSAETFLTEARLQIAELDRNIQELDQSLTDIKAFAERGAKGSYDDGRNENLQLSDGTLTQVIGLANQASLSEFVENILTSRRNLVAQKASLQTELNRAKAGLQLPSDDGFIGAAKKEYRNLTKEYVSLLDSSHKAQQLIYGNFFKPLGTPESIQATLPPKAFLILLLSLFFGGSLGILLALVWPNRKKIMQ